MKLLAVVVIYKLLPAESTTVQTLLQSREASRCSGPEVKLLIWDNTPNGQQPGDLPPGARYVSAPHNPGLSPAYNCALTIAQEEGCDWLLTLDQDTALPNNFLTRIAEISDQIDDDPTIAAILPRVIGNAKRLSPFRFAMDALPRALPDGLVGVSSYATYAVNSAATMRVASLLRRDGYNVLFPLDISDIDLFHRIAQAGMSVYVAGDLVVSHDFSLLDKRGRMSPERYRSMLRDECAFWDMNMNALARAERLVRLTGRICKDLFRPGSSEFRRITAAEIIRRLVIPRSTRIKKWTDWANSRRTASIHSNFDSDRQAGHCDRSGGLELSHIPRERSKSIHN